MTPKDYTEQAICDALRDCEDNKAASVAAAIVLSGLIGARLRKALPASEVHYVEDLDKSVDVLVSAVQYLLEEYEEDRANKVRRLLDAMTGAMLTYNAITDVQRKASAG